MHAPHPQAADPLSRIRSDIERALALALDDARTELDRRDAGATLLVDELTRLVRAGGKRIRPLFCVLGHSAGDAGGDVDRIATAAAGLELLHTMALIHDDLMDGSLERRGVPTTHRHLGEAARRRGAADPEALGRSLAVLAGDLAAVLADRSFLRAGFAPDRLRDALGVYTAMRLDMAAGQALDLLGSDARAAAALRGGSYTVAAPLAIGAALGGARPEVRASLAAFGAPLGEAFQLLDDLRDRDHGSIDRARIASLVDRARLAIRSDAIGAEVADSLSLMADLVALA
jgi:geranylgeranyl diphosphate synthase, type I